MYFCKDRNILLSIKPEIFYHVQTTPEKKNNKKRPLPFWAKVCINLVLMLVAFFVILWLASLWLGVWTHHGEFSVVPKVEGLSYNDAVRRLVDDDFQCEIADSIYDTKMRPGVVVAQLPKEGSKVKGKRVIYLTVNAFSPKTVKVPQLVDMSQRQAVSTLESLGFGNISVREIPSEFEGLVLAARYNGRPLTPGLRIPVNASIVIEVGTGYMPQVDSLAVDGAFVIDGEEPTVSFEMMD